MRWPTGRGPVHRSQMHSVQVVAHKSLLHIDTFDGQTQKPSVHGPK